LVKGSNCLYGLDDPICVQFAQSSCVFKSIQDTCPTKCLCWNSF
jgi:hypothetical protein